MLTCKLPKFVQINWCGDGVPEVKKAHAMSPMSIMSRIKSMSDAKYSAHNETTCKFKPIAPQTYQLTTIIASDPSAEELSTQQIIISQI
ncbi:hypothetical protein BGW80DRAFT_1330732 [Lactifluus volemus]|nr:hypothetical protein BGW80DRAFT_1357962 [Lactifluus volemus]KAH9970422.1 hypothetical protein BGW80DRAFT_1330732 [Lactifluus volemus]